MANHRPLAGNSAFCAAACARSCLNGPLVCDSCLPFGPGHRSMGGLCDTRGHKRATANRGPLAGNSCLWHCPLCAQLLGMWLQAFNDPPLTRGQVSVARRLGPQGCRRYITSLSFSCTLRASEGVASLLLWFQAAPQGHRVGAQCRFLSTAPRCQLLHGDGPTPPAAATLRAARWVTAPSAPLPVRAAAGHTAPGT